MFFSKKEKQPRYVVVEIGSKWAVKDRYNSGYFLQCDGKSRWSLIESIRSRCLFSDKDKAKDLCKEMNSLNSALTLGKELQ